MSKRKAQLLEGGLSCYLLAIRKSEVNLYAPILDRGYAEELRLVIIDRHAYFGRFF